MEPSRVATDRGGDKTESLELDWLHPEKTERTRRQVDPGVEHTGKAQERRTPSHLEAQQKDRVGGETACVA